MRVFLAFVVTITCTDNRIINDIRYKIFRRKMKKEIDLDEISNYIAIREKEHEEKEVQKDIIRKQELEELGITGIPDEVIMSRRDWIETTITSWDLSVKARWDIRLLRRFYEDHQDEIDRMIDYYSLVLE